MQCPDCGKTGRVTIAGMQYCTTCGHAFGADPAAPKTMKDVQVPPTAAVPAPGPTPSPTPTAVAATTPNPASSFHGPAAAGVLDLRDSPKPPAIKPTSSPAKSSSAVEVKPAAPILTPTPMPTPTPVNVAPRTQVTPVKVSAEATPTPTPTVSANQVIGSRKDARLANAQNVGQSTQIKKFSSAKAIEQPTVAELPVATVPLPSMAESIVPTPSAVPVATSPAPKTSELIMTPMTQAPMVATPTVSVPAPSIPVPASQPVPQTPPPVATASSSPAPTSAVMPGIVATTVEANKRLLTPAAMAQADPQTARKEAFALAMANAPKRSSTTSAIAASLAVLIMGGYIWLQNAPKLAIHTASNKAGFEATVPTYIPSTYSLKNSASASPGRVTLALTAPGKATITLSQQKTDWDSRSLLDNYVSKQTNQYLAVAGQGLTVYLYNGGGASWVNRGVWYSIHGNNQLNREQILKIAYGL